MAEAWTDSAATSDRLRKLHAALEGRKPGDGPARIVGASGGFAGFVLSALRRELDRPLTVLVTADEARAAELAQAIRFFEPSTREVDPVPVYPPLDHVPFQGMSPSRGLVMERVALGFRLVHDLGVQVLVVPAPALLDRILPRDVLEEQTWVVMANHRLEREQLLEFLAATGYHPVDTVEDPGTFATRGGIVDVFCPLYPEPLRIELWGDEVDSLRLFDPGSQRTTRKLDSAFLGPVRDILFDKQTTRRARNAILDLADERHVPTSRAKALVDDLSSGVLAVGMEDLLPAFYERLGTLSGLIPSDALWVVDEPAQVAEALAERWTELDRRSRLALAEDGALVFEAEQLYMPADEARRGLEARADVVLEGLAIADGGEGTDAEPAAAWGAPAPSLDVTWHADDNRDVRQAIEEAARADRDHVLAPLTSRVRKWRDDGWVVVACAHTEGGAERLRGLLTAYGTKVADHVEGGPFDLDQVPALRGDAHELHLYVGEAGRGFRSRELGLVLLDEAEILGTRAHRRRRRHAQVAPEHSLASWRDLHEGDLVVHLQHGIGRYAGLQKTPVAGLEVDFLVLEYADGNRLFVPVDKLHLVSKHSGASEDGGPAKLDKLGGQGWKRTRNRITKAVRNIADKLLKLYAQRAMQEGTACSAPGEYFARFEAAFPWEETPDQGQAIEDVLEDLQKPRPMDRLIVGDVGFGKTEVAMRGAMLAVLSGRQVAVLVPTLVLAEQHRMTFERRFEGFPVTIRTLTRGSSTRELRETKLAVSTGGVDILIGTHRVLSKDIEFKNLGLIVVDEEHRFGVAQKERLKEYKKTVDVLTLTATPIPRTLHLSMVGLRDISLIRTPPTDRLPVRTLVAQPNERVLTEAIQRELKRGGQVFYVHNRVEDIHKHAELLNRLVPEARIAVGHGQMPKDKLQEVMARFVRGEANLLVATTIIESGLDIPNANTMLIHRADRFGLAQLHQLRGRVGRSSVRAFCYLLVPAPKNLAGDAKKRIGAIQRFAELGGGFDIASHDLDIRGAGDMLGADQAGHIDAVGYDAYMALLQEAIEELRAREEHRETRTVDPELKIHIQARIPEKWLPETTLRLRLYKQLAGAGSSGEVYELFQDAVDRYGHAPDEVRNLVDVMAVKCEARRLGLSSVSYNQVRLTFGIDDHSVLLEDLRVARYVERPRSPLKLTPKQTLVMDIDEPTYARGLEPVLEVLRDLSEWLDRVR